MFHSIKTKFIAIVFGILLFMVGIQLVCNYFLVGPFYAQKKTRVIQEAYAELRQLSGRREEMIKVMRHYEEAHNIQFLLSNQEFVCIYNSRQQEFFIRNNKYRVRSNFSFRKNSYRFSKQPAVVSYSKDGIGKKKGRLALFGILDLEKEYYYVVIKSNVKAIQEGSKETSELVLFFNAIALVIGGIIAYIFGKKVTEPILEINDVASHVAKLNFTRKVKKRKQIFEDEITHLGNSVNIMSNQIEETIRKLKEENEIRKKMEETRKEFIANVSHELKTPLSILGGYAQMLLVAGENIDKGYYCEVILDEAKRMTDLVNQLLEIARMEREMDIVQMERINMSDIIKEQVQKREVLLQEKGIILEEQIENNCYIKANQEQIEVIFNNYMSNAISHIKGEKRIKVAVKREGDQVVFSVFNTGDWIPNEKIDKIWDSFYQVEESHTRKEEGRRVGLGLSIVHMIVQVHKGTCSVSNVENGVMFTCSMQYMEDE